MKFSKLRKSHSALAAAGIIVVSCLPSLALALPDFAELVERNASSVVSVNTLTLRVSDSRLPDEREGNAYRLPHGKFELSSGTGFIISNDGFIVTSAHVVNEVDRIMVRTGDRREFPAELVGIDLDTDVALLKIEAGDLTSVRVGNSAALRVGDWVLAIGAPFGLEQSATVGIVSGLARTIPSEMYVPFIQTDVVVNPGNSGGPLFNESGEVIGVTSQILSPDGVYTGVTFAIPINDAMRVAEQLRSQGYATRGWLGVGVRPVDQAVANLLALDRPHGALLLEVVPGGPADKAGLQQGDLVIEFDGKRIEQAIDLLVLAGAAPIDEDVRLTVQRRGVRFERTITIAEQHDGVLALRSGR